jgi:ABC-type glycerol-3-phosphate transport system substrate-binding protein
MLGRAECYGKLGACPSCLPGFALFGVRVNPLMKAILERSAAHCLHATSWVLAAVVCALALTACGRDQSQTVPQETETPAPTEIPAPIPTRVGTPTPEVEARIAIWTAWDPAEIDALRQVIALFRVQHPEIEVSLAYHPQDQLLDAYRACLASGGCPTILIGPSDWGPLLVQEEGTVDVSAFIDPQLQNDLYPVAWSQVVYQEVMTGLPLELQGVVLYRNSDLVPERSSQLSGLIRDAVELRQETQQASVFDFGFLNAASFLAACEGSVFSPDGNLAISGQSAICWLDMLRDWANAGRTVIDSDEDRQAFLAGRSGWLIDSSLLLQALSRELGPDTLTVDPWPALSSTGEALKGYAWTENVYLSSRIEMADLEASWTFARFLFEAPAQAILSDPDGAAHIPAQESVTLENARMQTISAMLRSGIPLPLRTDLPRFITPIDHLLDTVILKGGDPQEALNVLQLQLATATPTPSATP